MASTITDRDGRVDV